MLVEWSGMVGYSVNGRAADDDSVAPSRGELVNPMLKVAKIRDLMGVGWDDPIEITLDLRRIKDRRSVPQVLLLTDDIGVFDLGFCAKI